MTQDFSIMQCEEYFSLNHVNLAGTILSIEPVEVSEAGAHLVAHLQTHEEGHPHAVVFENRNALKCLAFSRAHNDMYPEEPLSAHIMGSIKTNGQRTFISGLSVVFLVPFDVRKRGEQMEKAMVKRYVEQYGDRPWLLVDNPNHTTSMRS